MSEIPNWTVEEVDDSGRPIGWRNNETQTFIGIYYDDDEQNWVVSGENTRISTEEEVNEAREKATEFMLSTPRPSSMI